MRLGHERIGVVWLRAVAAGVACVGAVLTVPSSGHADFMVDSNRYCGAGTDSLITGDTVPGSLLSLNDVTLTISSPPDPQFKASNCYGDFDTQNSGINAQTDAVNAIFGASSGPNQLVFLAKHEEGEPSSSGSSDGLDGIVFEILTDGGEDGAAGTWTISWKDTNGSDPANLPLLVDLVALLKGSDNSAAYLLSSVLLPLSPTTGEGSFDIEFFINGGKQCEDSDYHQYDGYKKKEKECDTKQPSLSHLTLFGRIVSRTIEVAEPATMTMFGVGLMGLWTLRRRWSR